MGVLGSFEKEMAWHSGNILTVKKKTLQMCLDSVTPWLAAMLKSQIAFGKVGGGQCQGER